MSSYFDFNPDEQLRLEAERLKIEEDEFNRLLSLERTHPIMGRFNHHAQRVSIRGLRIAGGLLLLAFAFGATGQTIAFLVLPFAAWTIIGAVLAFLCGWLALFLFPASWICAFGDGPTAEQRDADRWTQAKTNVANEINSRVFGR